jgi:hypothetical protein
LGPIHIVLQDVLVVAALAALMHEPQTSPWYLPLFFLFANLLGLAATFFPLGQVWTGYAVAFGLGLVVALWGDPTTAVGASVALYLVAFLGLRRSLEAFPWTGVKSSADLQREVQERLQSKRRLGWPFDWLAPHASECRISLRDGTMLSLLAGWWCYVILSRVTNPMAVEPVAGMFSLVILVAPLIRLIVYVSYFRSPLGLWARFWTGRWIIPRYDRVFLVPLCGVLWAAAALFRSILRSGCRWWSASLWRSR